MAANTAGATTAGGPNGAAAAAAAPPTAPKPKGRPSPEEIEAKRRQRAEKKAQETKQLAAREQAGTVGVGKDGKAPFATRSWTPVVAEKGSSSRSSHGSSATTTGNRIRIVSWNILAQGLVRRKLFPGSDCLKWKEREPGLTAEMLSHNWDIGAFQEVDRIDVHGLNLNKNGRQYLYAKGYAEKQHGLMIAWRQGQGKPSAINSPTFGKVGEKVVFFDREHVDTVGTTASSERPARTALSRITRNIALFAALKRDNGSGKDGIIVATTHLFWHPMHAYERVRQTGILKRRLLEWREGNPDWRDWPIVLAGDFNDQPHSAAYKLMTGHPLTEHCLAEVRESTVVHKSVDELRAKEANDNVSFPSTGNGAGSTPETDPESTPASKETSGAAPNDTEGDGEGEGEEDDEEEEGGTDDQMLKNCRAAHDSDGLLSFAEIVQLHDLSRPAPGQKSSPSTSPSASDSLLVGQRIGCALTSAYGSAHNRLEPSQDGNYFGSAGRGRERHDDAEWKPDTPNIHLGPSVEPMYTLYSSLFALTLDYIFLFPSSDAMETIHSAAADAPSTFEPQAQTTPPAPLPSVTALLPTHRTDVLAPGVPRRGVCASDHVVVGAELAL